MSRCIHLICALALLAGPLTVPAESPPPTPVPVAAPASIPVIPPGSNITTTATATNVAAEPVTFQPPPEQPPPLDSDTGGLAVAPASLTAPGNSTAAGNVTRPIPVNRSFPLTPSEGHLFGTWGGGLPYLESIGITPSLNFTSDMAGNPTGGIRQGFTAANNLGLGVLFDLDKIANVSNTTFLVQVSERFGPSLTKKDIGNVFNVQQDWGGQTIRVVDVALQPKLLNNTLQLRIGRIAAGDDFLVSHYDYLFMQNGFCGNPVGIFFNAPGMTAYPNAAWGVLARFKPTKRWYIMGGVYNGDPSVRANDHHGMDWSMHGPLFAIAETGYQFNGQPGDTGLLGNYKAGMWFDNAVYPEYSTQGPLVTGQTTNGNWGFYTLFDQMLFRFDPSDRNRGLGIFGSFLASPNQNISQLPYFFTAGVAALGLFPNRPQDTTGFGVLWGSFSTDLAAAQQREGLPSQNYEMALEVTHRLLFDDGALFVQPDIQYIIHPGGTGDISNALVLGAQVGLNF